MVVVPSPSWPEKLDPQQRAVPFVRNAHECRPPAAMTALPHPAKVSQNVPIASAVYFLVFILASCMFRLPHAREGP